MVNLLDSPAYTTENSNHLVVYPKLTRVNNTPPSSTPFVSLIALLAMLCFNLLCFFIQVSPGVSAQQTALTLHETSQHFLSDAANFYITYFIMQVPTGFILDRYKTCYVLPIILLVCAISCWMFAIANSSTMVIVSHLILGSGCAFSFVGTLYIAASQFPSRLYPLLVGLTEIIGAIGAMAAQTPLAIMISKVGWRHCFMAIAIAFLVLIPILYFTTRKLNKSHDTIQDPLLLRIQKTLACLKNKQIIYICIYAAMLWLPMISLAGFWGVPYLHKIRNFNMVQASMAFSVMWLAFAVFAPLSGAISNHIERRKGMMVFLALIGLGACIVFTDSTLHNYSVWLVALFVSGIACTGVPLCFSAIADITPRSVIGSSIGIVNMAIVLGGIVGEFVIGHVLKRLADIDNREHFILSDWHIAFKIIPVAFLIALIVSIYLIKETRAKPYTLLDQ